MAAPPLLLRSVPLHRLRLHNRLFGGIFRSAAASTDSARPEEKVPHVDKPTVLLSTKEPPKFHRWDDPDYRKWKHKEEEIWRDIKQTVELAKDILHSDRYLDGAQLSADDERFVVEKLLSYHPRAEDKIGCGLDFIMVDRHPQFRFSRCMFVVRTDGIWIDFSYQKCLREYIRSKYPLHAERFIQQHFKRGSG